MDKGLFDRENDGKNQYVNACKKVMKNLAVLTGISIDPKRQVGSAAKKLIWESSRTYEGFSPDYFRKYII